LLLLLLLLLLLGAGGFLQCQELLRSECLVVDLSGRLDEVLKVSSIERLERQYACERHSTGSELSESSVELHMGRGGWDVPSEKVPQVVELAVLLVLDVDDSPSVLAPSDGLAIDDDVSLGSYDGERDHVLSWHGQDEIRGRRREGNERGWPRSTGSPPRRSLRCQRGRHGCCGAAARRGSISLVSRLRAVEPSHETYPLLEQLPLLQSQTVTLGDNRHHVDDLAELLHHRDVDGLKRVACRGDEVEAAVNAGVDDVLVSHRGELLAEVPRVLVLDVLDDGFPAAEVGVSVRTRDEKGGLTIRRC
jgi:hypothetical protein